MMSDLKSLMLCCAVGLFAAQEAKAQSAATPAAGTGAAAHPSTAQSEAGEPRASMAPESSGADAPGAAVPGAAEVGSGGTTPPAATPAAPASTSRTPRRATGAAAPGAAGRGAGAVAPGKPPADDRLELGTATVTGDQEQPKVMYIVPWKKSDIGDLSGKPMNSLLDEALAPVDREEFKRQVVYYEAVKADASQNGASKAQAQQGEK